MVYIESCRKPLKPARMSSGKKVREVYRLFCR